MSISAVAAVALAAVAALFTPSHLPNAGDQFFTSLKDLCGARFEGAMTFPPEGKDAFAGKLLVASVASCSEVEIRVPFLVGEDSSRTWIFRRTVSGLQLKHDHRHADGTPDAVTMYGGMASTAGTPFMQSFAADSETAKLIPAAGSNVWTVNLSADGTSLTYHLDRGAKPRFTAVLKRVR